MRSDAGLRISIDTSFTFVSCRQCKRGRARQFLVRSYFVDKWHGCPPQTVADRMAQGLDVAFGCVATRVAWGADGVTVTCEDGRTFAADALIVTVSLGVLKVNVRPEEDGGVHAASETQRVQRGMHAHGSVPSLRTGAVAVLTAALWTTTHGVVDTGFDYSLHLNNAQATHERMFDPPLPADKAEVIARMGFGVINKVYIVSDAPKNQVCGGPLIVGLLAEYLFS